MVSCVSEPITRRALFSVFTVLLVAKENIYPPVSTARLSD